MSAWGLRPVPDAVPERLRALPRWVCWLGIRRAGKDKHDKVPVQPANGQRASTADPSHWSTFEAACAYQAAHPDVSGIGLVLTGNLEHLFAIDIDGAELSDPRVTQLLGLQGLYIERSPSGNGYRALGFGEAVEFTNHGAGVEVYTGATARFVTVTGATVAAGTDALRTQPERLARFLAAYRPPEQVRLTRGAGPHPPVPEVEDAQLFQYARALLPARLLPRWDEGTVPEAFPSRSEVDAAIALALIAGGLETTDAWRACIANGHLLQRALDARQGKMPRALQFIWEEVNVAAGYEREHPRRPPEADDFAGDDGSPLNTKEKNVHEGTNPEHAKTLAHAARRGKLVRASDLNQRPQIDWLVQDYIEAGTLVMLFGEPGTGKSFVALDMAAAVARGAPWVDRRTTRGMVVYVAGEGHHGLARRLSAHAKHHGYDINTLDLFVSRMGVPLTSAEAVAELLEEIRTLELLYDCNCSLVIVDTLRRNFGIGDENSTKDMGAFIAGCSVLQHALATTLMVVHHTGHADKGRERGSSTLIGDFDIRYQVGKVPAGHFLRNAKMKDAEAPPELPFALEQVPLGYQDEDGRDITSAVVTWGRPRADDDTAGEDALLHPRRAPERRAKLHYGASALLELLERMQTTAGEAPPPDCVDQGAVRVVRRDDWLAAMVAARICRTDDAASSRRSFNRWSLQLTNEGLVEGSDDQVFAWVTVEGEAQLRASSPLFT